jgi:hypothetical protein
MQAIITATKDTPGPNCTLCRHARRPPDQFTGLICTRYPPTGQLAQTPQGPIALPVWAPVSDQTVCGEFSAAPAANSTN